MSDNRYQVKALKQFRVLSKQFGGVEMELVKEKGDILIYKILDEDFVKMALDLGIIMEEKASNMITVFSPSELEDYFNSVVQNVYSSENVEYVITTDRGNITISIDDVFTTKVWKTQLFSHCKIIIAFALHTKEMKKEFNEMLIWIANTATVNEVSTHSDEDIEGDMIMSKLGMFEVVDDKEDFTEYVGLNIDVHGEPTYYVRSTALKGIVEGLGYYFNSHTYKVLNPYLIDTSKQIVMEGEQFSVWQFKPWDVI